MFRKVLCIPELWLLAVLTLAGCATVPPAPKQSSVPVVDSEGTLDPARRTEFLDDLADRSDSEVVSALLDDIVALSHTPLFLDNDVQLLIDGPETYDSMVSAIEGAEHHVLLESYIFSDDEVGEMFSGLLRRRSGEGITVKVIYDSLGSVESRAEFFEEMKASGIDLIEFNVVNPLKGEMPLDFNNRDHRKILVVDGTIAYTGGINLSSTYSSSSSWPSGGNLQTTGWRDTQIAIRGPAASGFQQLFVDNWKAMGGRVEAPLFSPQDWDDAGGEIVAILSAQGGDEVHSEIFEAYLSAIEAARQRVWITQAYFAPDKDFMGRLKRAALRGVDVRIIVPGVTDSKLALNASRSRYRQLLEAGIGVYERQNALLHAKTAVIDGIWSTVGSSNLDNRSFVHNDEVNAIIIGDRFAEAMEHQFEFDMQQSRQISLAEWKERSLWKRIAEKLSWIVEYWL